MENTLKTCAECGKNLKGRVDKKFCDDYCRNAYNNKQNSDQSNYVRNINNVLRRNRRILQGFIPDDGAGMAKLPKQKLFSAGFDPQYHTHQYQNKKGDTYRFCYEYGWLPIEGDWVLVVQRKEGSGAV